MTAVPLPKISLNTTDAAVVEWLVADGERVDAGDPIVEVESEKATQVIDAPEAGVLHHRSAVGDRVPVGDTLAVIGDANGATDGEESEPDATAEADPVAPPSARRLARELNVALADVDGSGPSGRITAADVRSAAEATERATSRASGDGVRASPAARAAARDAGVDLDAVPGSGPDGAVVLADVEGTPPTARSGLTVAERRPLEGTRGTIAERMTASWRDAPHVTLDRDMDVTRALAVVGDLDGRLDVPVSFSDVLLAAVVAALEEHPAVNARLEDDVHVLYDERNVAVAVDADRGLVAPVLHGAGERSFTGLAEARRDVVSRATAGRLDAADLEGGTFTISNLGPLGVRSFTPIINPPQVAILGVGATRRDPVETADGVAFRDAVTLSLSFDHRAIDGADGARFLATLDDLLGAPAALLVD